MFTSIILQLCSSIYIFISIVSAEYSCKQVDNVIDSFFVNHRERMTIQPFTTNSIRLSSTSIVHDARDDFNQVVFIVDYIEYVCLIAKTISTDIPVRHTSVFDYRSHDNGFGNLSIKSTK